MKAVEAALDGAGPAPWELRKFLVAEALGVGAVYGPTPALGRQDFEMVWAMLTSVVAARNRTPEQQQAAASARRAIQLDQDRAPGADIPNPNLGLPAHLRAQQPPGIPFDPGF